MTGESLPPATHISDQHTRFRQAFASPSSNPERGITAWGCDRRSPRDRRRRLACSMSPLISPSRAET
jgi:hypothetical protein